MEQPIIKKKHSEQSKRAAVDRMAAGESPSDLARELGVKRTLLYRWKDQGFGTKPNGKAKVREKPSPHERQVATLKEQITKLQQLVGKQTADLDFFAAALCNVKEKRPNKGASSVWGSTARSNR